MKKYLYLFLIPIGILATNYCFAFTENFDSYPTNASSTASTPWTSGIINTSNNKLFSSPNSATGNYDAFAFYTFASSTTGLIELSFYYYVADGETDLAGKFIVGKNTETTKAVNLRIGQDAKFYWTDGFTEKNQTMDGNTWNFVKVIINPANGTFDLYLNNFTFLNQNFVDYGAGSYIDYFHFWPSSVANHSFTDNIYFGEYSDLSVSKILTTTPLNNETIASSSPANIGFSANLIGDDYKNSRFKIEVFPYKNSFVASILSQFSQAYPLYQYYAYPTSTGVFSFSTTTAENLPENSYYLKIKLQTSCQNLPLVGYTCFGENKNVATSTKFFSGKRSNTEEALYNFGEEVGQNITSTTTQAMLASCGLLNFDLSLCLGALFVPNSAIIAEHLNDFASELGTRFPLGYLTRFIYLAIQDPVKPPPMTIALGNSVPVDLRGSTTIDLFGRLSLIEEIKTDNAEQKTIWDILMPWFNAFLWLGLLITIIADVIRIEIVSRKNYLNTFETDAEIQRKNWEREKLKRL